MFTAARFAAACRKAQHHVYTAAVARSVHLQPPLRTATISNKGLEAAVQSSVKPLHMPTVAASKQRPSSPFAVFRSLAPLLAYKMIYDWSFDAREFDNGVQRAYIALHEAVDQDTVDSTQPLVSSAVLERLKAMAELQRGLPNGSELSVAKIDSVYLLRSMFSRRNGERMFLIDVEFQAQVSHAMLWWCCLLQVFLTVLHRKSTSSRTWRET